ncbi:transposase [Streptomyces vinaceus]
MSRSPGRFGVRGAPGMSPGVLSLVTVLQFAEDLTDRQAAGMAVRAVDWKYALGMELTDTGFDASVLSRFRGRLADNGMERVVFDRLLEHCKEAGLVFAGGRQRTDSTHVISAVRDLNRLELAGESVRAALEALATAAPAWLAGQVGVTEFAERYGPRVDGWRMPSPQTKRDRLAQVFGQDALALCQAAWGADTPVWIREIEAVGLLRQVLMQTCIVRSGVRGRQVIRKRDAEDGAPPGQLRLASPYNTDARRAAKEEDPLWPSCKAHLTETCGTLPEAEAEAEAECRAAPNLITDVHTTDATVPDVKATAPIQRRLTGHGVKPAEHYPDSGHPSADLITDALKQGIRMLTPALLDRSAQARAAEGFDNSAFTIDWTNRQVRCPTGHASSHWNPVTQHGKDAIVITFSILTCRDCPFQQQCTASKPGRRMLTPRPRELHENLARARAGQKTDTWKNKYALRAGVEGTVNQALHITGIRRARYRGQPKVRLQHASSATALNVARLDAYSGPTTPSDAPAPAASNASPTHSPRNPYKLRSRVRPAYKVQSLLGSRMRASASRRVKWCGHGPRSWSLTFLDVGLSWSFARSAGPGVPGMAGMESPLDGSENLATRSPATTRPLIGRRDAIVV